MWTDVTGDRLWDSGRLLQRVVTDPDSCAALLPANNQAIPPAEVLELGAGTGITAIMLATHWPCSRYVATDLPQRVDAIASRVRDHGLQDSITAAPLIWGANPPLPLITSESESATSLILLADLLYWSGSDVLEPDTLEPLAHTLSLALQQRPWAIAICTFRERNPEREEYFLQRLCHERYGLAVDAPLEAQRVAELSPGPEERTDVDALGPLRLWRIQSGSALEEGRVKG